MKKQLTEKTIYQPNRAVKVTVQNKPEFDEETGVVRYERKVTIAVSCGYSPEKIAFANDDDIAKWVETVSFEDPQMLLLEDGPEPGDEE